MIDKKRHFETMTKIRNATKNYKREIKEAQDACGALGHEWRIDIITTEEYCKYCLFSKGRKGV